MKNLFRLFLCFVTWTLNIYVGQSQTYSLKLVVDSIDYVNIKVCYKIGVTNTGDQNFYLAGQNYRLFYGSEKIEFIEDSGFSYLPAGIYTPFELVNTVKNVDATGIGVLPYEDNLGFINCYIDLNDTQNGGSFIKPDSTLYTARLCFDVVDKTLEVACFDITFANQEETGNYAAAFNEISAWNGPNSTGAALGEKYYDIHADTLSDCVDFNENSLIECNDGIDNDGNGLIDCEDMACGKPTIVNIQISNPTQASCPDGDNGSITITSDNTTRYSNDSGITWQGNGIFTDLAGSTYNMQLINDATGCVTDTMITLAAVICNEICNDGIDNDGNGLIDCEDMSCGKPTIVSIQISNPTQASCPDGDNGMITINSGNTTRYSKDGGITWQGNGIFTDLVGSTYNMQLINDATGCVTDSMITLPDVLCNEICNDGIDNDGNGLIDCEDMSCSKPTIVNIQITNPTQASCPDGDNGSITITSDNTTRYSKDGGISWQSSGIFTDLEGSVYHIQIINDVIGCVTDTMVTLTPVICSEICNIGIDNDGNGLIDCEDMLCDCDNNIPDFVYPNIFSPSNGDGINDQLNIFLNQNHYENYVDIEIFNRWGDLIHKKNKQEITKLWDGNYRDGSQRVAQGIYIIKIVMYNKRSTLKEVKVFSLTLI